MIDSQVHVKVYVKVHVKSHVKVPVTVHEKVIQQTSNSEVHFSPQPILFEKSQFLLILHKIKKKMVSNLYAKLPRNFF